MLEKELSFQEMDHRTRYGSNRAPQSQICVKKRTGPILQGGVKQGLEPVDGQHMGSWPLLGIDELIGGELDIP